MNRSSSPSRGTSIPRLLDAVVIESAALRVDESLVRIVVDACTAALAEDQCAVGPRSTGARVSATVELDEGAQAARIELRNRSVTVTRVLRFAPSDSPAERWKSIGLVIGTLAESASSESAPIENPQVPTPNRTTASTPRKDDASAARTPDVPQTPGSRRLWLDAGVIVGPALDDGTWRAGPALAASYGLGDTPLSAGLTVRLTTRPSDARGVAVTWLGGGAGLGARLPFAERSIWVEPRGELVAEQMRASIDDPSSGRADDAALWSVGARLSTLVSWMPSDASGVWAGGEVTALQAGVSIRVGRDETARLAPFGGALSIGARVAPF